jgi:spermidine synthase
MNQVVSLYVDARGVQSTMLRHEPYALALGYTRTVMGFLLFQPFPCRISMIGLVAAHWRNTAIAICPTP